MNKTFVAILLCCLTPLSVLSADQLKPNVVFILADDMNYECCCGEEIARENHCFSPSSEMN